MRWSLCTWHLFLLLCHCGIACLCALRGENSNSGSDQQGSFHIAPHAVDKCESFDTLRTFYKFDGPSTKTLKERKKLQKDGKKKKEILFLQKSANVLDTMAEKVEANKDILIVLFMKQQESRLKNNFVGVHSKSPRDIVLHILGSLGKTNINIRGDIVQIRKQISKLSRNRETFKNVESHSIMSASFSILDTAPKAEGFIDHYLGKSVSDASRNSSSNWSSTSSANELLEEQLSQDALQVSQPQFQRLQGILQKYKQMLTSYQQKSELRSLSVPFVIQAADELMRKQADGGRPWKDEFEQYAYVSKANGVPMFASGSNKGGEDEEEEALLGRIVYGMKDALKTWMGLPSCSQPNEFSWKTLAERNLKLHHDNNYKLYGYHSFSSAVFSQLRIPYHFIHSPTPMFELEPVYTDLARMVLDADLCDEIAEIFNDPEGPKSKFCEHVTAGNCQQKPDDEGFWPYYYCWLYGRQACTGSCEFVYTNHIVFKSVKA
eukprot:TRINITY_DN10459_c0_g1_i1.p1 TRINITY_DN10459_c0_g1~~TRINITY_DN10459_c0_g1_i1.p1  ORF type:complete len:491 (+),score=41.52 TRINITY_DN10459_c0_g1_i1:65-1537(+)